MMELLEILFSESAMIASSSEAKQIAGASNLSKFWSRIADCLTTAPSHSWG